MEMLLTASVPSENTLLGAFYRDVLRKRARHLISDAMIGLLAVLPIKYDAHQDHVFALREHGKKFAILCANGGDDEVDKLEVPVMKKLQRYDSISRATIPGILSSFYMNNQLAAATSAVNALLDVTPSEASVERVFSAMKLNVTPYRKRLTAEAALSQVVAKICLAYERSPEKELPSTTVTAKTITWIITTAANAGLLGPTVRIHSDVCFFDESHEGDLMHCDFCNRSICTQCHRARNGALSLLHLELPNKSELVDHLTCEYCTAAGFRYPSYESLQESYGGGRVKNEPVAPKRPRSPVEAHATPVAEEVQPSRRERRFAARNGTQ